MKCPGHASSRRSTSLYTDAGGAEAAQWVEYSIDTAEIRARVLPQGAEQFINADACLPAVAALTLAPGDVSAGTVAAAATRLLAEPTVTVAAAAVRAEIESMPDAKEVITRLTPDELR